MIAGRWFITPHAVRSFIERVDASATYEQALATLIDWSMVAKPNKWISERVLQFRGPRPRRCRLRVSYSEDESKAPQLLTVIKGNDIRELEPSMKRTLRTAPQILHAAAGSPAADGCSQIDQAARCYICAGRAERGMPRISWMGANFTDQNNVLVPDSDTVCEACVYVCKWTAPPGRPPKPGQTKGTQWRMYSHMWESGWEGLQAPEYANASKAEKSIVRDFISRDHQGHWLAVIADSGKKHLIPWCPVNRSKGSGGYVLFDDLRVSIPRDTSLIEDMTTLLDAGVSKHEIETGNYSSFSWIRNEQAIHRFEAVNSRDRSLPWFVLAVWLSQRKNRKASQ